MKPSTAAGLLLTVAVLATMLVAPSASAVPTWSNIAVSRNGTIWTDDIVQPMIGNTVRLVPGQAKTRTFYVRNQSDEAAYLKVVTRVRADGQNLGTKGFRTSLLVDGAWHDLAKGHHRVTRFLTRAGDVVPVTIRIRMDKHAGRRLMDQHLKLTVRLRLTHQNQTGR